MEPVDVKPPLSSSLVGYKNEIDWPLGRSEGVGVDGRLRGAVSRCESHLGGAQGDEDLYVVMC